jgi:hypothetical protein
MEDVTNKFRVEKKYVVERQIWWRYVWPWVNPAPYYTLVPW